MISKELAVVRELRISDIIPLNKMYDSFSSESKRYFHPGFLGLRYISFRWFLAQTSLATSAFKPLRKLLLRVYTPSVFLSMVATNEFNEIIGFIFIKVKRRASKKNFLWELGIFVREDYQGKGVGSKLTESLIELARKENVKKIHLTVLTDNVIAIHIYKKYGFKTKRGIMGGDIWRGQRYDSIEMWLDIP
ncbi:MAG: N-acetyltransferase family protein [Candidatus Lokiarchaeia archaeon]